MTVVAATAAGLAVLVWRPPGRWWVRRRLGAVGVPRARPTRLAVVMVLVLAAGPVLISLSGPHVLLGVTVVSVAGFVVRQVGAGRRREQVAELRTSVAEMLGLMSAELRAGALPSRVLAGLAGDFDFLRPAARATELGGDGPGALRSAATRPGLEVLAQVAGAWQVAERAGAPLAQVLGRLEETSRAEREIEREVESGLAPARATARLMAVLPAVGLLLGSGMGGDPVGVLTGTWAGVVCLAAGCGLACGGLAWVERIASSVEREP